MAIIVSGIWLCQIAIKYGDYYDVEWLAKFFGKHQPIDSFFHFCFAIVLVYYFVVVAALAVSVWFIARFIRENQLSTNLKGGLNVTVSLMHFLNLVCSATSVYLLMISANYLRQTGHTCLEYAQMKLFCTKMNVVFHVVDFISLLITYLTVYKISKVHNRVLKSEKLDATLTETHRDSEQPSGLLFEEMNILENSKVQTYFKEISPVSMTRELDVSIVIAQLFTTDPVDNFLAKSTRSIKAAQEQNQSLQNSDHHRSVAEIVYKV